MTVHYLPSLGSGKSCWNLYHCSSETLVLLHWSCLGFELAGATLSHKTPKNLADEATQAYLQ